MDYITYLDFHGNPFLVQKNPQFTKFLKFRGLVGGLKRPILYVVGKYIVKKCCVEYRFSSLTIYCVETKHSIAQVSSSSLQFFWVQNRTRYCKFTQIGAKIEAMRILRSNPYRMLTEPLRGLQKSLTCTGESETDKESCSTEVHIVLKLLPNLFFKENWLLSNPFLRQGNFLFKENQ